LDDGEHGETEVEVNYIELCWQFAKKNIQSILANKCLSIFRQVPDVVKTVVKTVVKAVVKTVAKAVVNTVAQAVVKAVVNTVAKVVVKAAVKTVVKTIVKNGTFAPSFLIDVPASCAR